MPMLGQDTRASTRNKIGTTIIDASGSDQNPISFYLINVPCNFQLMFVTSYNHKLTCNEPWIAMGRWCSRNSYRTIAGRARRGKVKQNTPSLRVH